MRPADAAGRIFFFLRLYTLISIKPRREKYEETYHDTVIGAALRLLVRTGQACYKHELARPEAVCC